MPLPPAPRPVYYYGQPAYVVAPPAYVVAPAISGLSPGSGSTNSSTSA